MKARYSSKENGCDSDTLGQVKCLDGSRSPSAGLQGDVNSPSSSSADSSSSSSSSSSEGEGESSLRNIVGKKYEDEYGRFDDGRARLKSDNKTLLSVDLSSPLGVHCLPVVQAMKLSVTLRPRAKSNNFSKPSPASPQHALPPPGSSASGSSTFTSTFKTPRLYIPPAQEQFCLKPISAYQAKLLANNEVPVTYRSSSKGYMVSFMDIH